MVYLFLADGFEEIEALCTVDILRRASVDIKTVGIGSQTVKGSHGIKVTADISESEATFDDLEMIVLPGGMPGTLNLEKSPVVSAFIEHAAKNALFIGAICAAPSILGHKGLLNGKRAIAFPGFEKDLAGAEIAKIPVVRDGNIITARGMGVATEFALELLSALKGKNVADKVSSAICKP